MWADILNLLLLFPALGLALPFAEAQVAKIKDAIQLFSAVSCVKWVPRYTQKDFVKFFHFYYKETCNSPVGRIGGEQVINLGDECFNDNGFRGAIPHEMMHALGFIHEQQRVDRDCFVKVAKQASVHNAGQDEAEQHVLWRANFLSAVSSAVCSVPEGADAVTVPWTRRLELLKDVSGYASINTVQEYMANSHFHEHRPSEPLKNVPRYASINTTVGHGFHEHRPSEPLKNVTRYASINTEVLGTQDFSLSSWDIKKLKYAYCGKPHFCDTNPQKCKEMDEAEKFCKMIPAQSKPRLL
ncbi:Meprin A subunit beta [Homalodisca vitripennis]|nr:Meprin A subunit beta [Homalodisca vitripennis]